MNYFYQMFIIYYFYLIYLYFERFNRLYQPNINSFKLICFELSFIKIILSL